MLSEVCHNVCIEPRLQPLTGESFDHNSANSGNEARLDVAVNGVWGSRFERTFFDVRIFNPFATSNRCATLSVAYRPQTLGEKKKIIPTTCIGCGTFLILATCTFIYWWNGEVLYIFIQAISIIDW